MTVVSDGGKGVAEFFCAGRTHLLLRTPRLSMHGTTGRSFESGCSSRNGSFDGLPGDEELELRGSFLLMCWSLADGSGNNAPVWEY